jgi:hypothetical protein
VAEFLVEMYVSRTESPGAVPPSEDVSRVAEQITREGRQVRLVRSIVVPEEETCFYLFEARTAEVVRDAATRAGLQFERVVEAIEDWKSPPTESDPAALVHDRAIGLGEQPSEVPTCHRQATTGGMQS